MAQRTYLSDRGWQEVEEVEEDEEDLRKSFINSQVAHQLSKQHYYDSHKLAIGYNELQVMTG